MKCKERNLKVKFYLQLKSDELQKLCLGFHFSTEGFVCLSEESDTKGVKKTPALGK